MIFTDKIELKKYLDEGLSTRQIAPLVGLNHRTVQYWIDKYKLTECMNYKKPVYNEEFFRKIDSPEKAYILGFILGDSCISDRNIEITLSIEDMEILTFIQKNIGGCFRNYYDMNKEKRKFPKSKMIVGNKPILNDLKTKSGGNLKEDRHIPVISEKLERYLLLGFFDAEGCVTYGKRKDRNRTWQKISFTSQFKMLEGIQKILLKNGISTSIKPKSSEKCFVMEFSSKPDVLKFISIIYDNEFVVLHRKYNKAIALRLELGEFGEA